MNTFRFSRVTRGVMLALALALLLVFVFAGALLASGGGQARWAALGQGGVTPQDVAGPDDYYVMALNGSGTVGPNCDGSGPIDYTVGDAILYFNQGQCWEHWFGGTESGLTRGQDINALHDDCGPDVPQCDIYLSFEQNSVSVPGVGKVRGQDIVKAVWADIDPPTYHNWSLFFDGSDVGLNANSERIDALFIFFPQDKPDSLAHCSQVMLISTNGAYSVPDEWGGWLTGGGEDVLGFCASWLGWDTAGYWFLYHDGSAQGMPNNALIGLAHEEGRRAFNRFDFITKGAFHADSADGGPSEVFRFWTQTGEYEGPFFSFGDDLGLTDKVDSFHIYYND